MKKSRRQKQQGFTLIELMIVVAIIGILATYAIPAYNAYMVKSRIAGVINSVQGLKTNMAADMVEFNSTAGSPDQTFTTLYGNEATDIATNDDFIGSITFDDTGGTITVALADDTRLGDAAGANLVFTPALVSGVGSVTWTCTSNLPAADRDLLPGSCRGDTAGGGGGSGGGGGGT